MGSKKAAASGKTKENKDAGRKADNPRVVLKGALAAAVAVVFALLGVSSWRGKRTAKEALTAEEQINMMGLNSELMGRIDAVAKKARNVEGEKKNLEEEKARLMKMVAEAEKEKAELASAVAAAKPSDAPDAGLGPSMMAAQSQLISRLLEMVQEVDTLRGEENREKRLAASQRVEVELAELEAKSQEQAGTTVGKQQSALIAIVRSALKSDANGEASDDDWSDDGLLKKHGLVTYATKTYWEEAYAGGKYGESFDWYGAWDEPDVQGLSLAGIVRPLLKRGMKSLVLGCGNSNLSAVLQQEGYTPLVSVDISESVIGQMRSRYAGYEGMEWRTADVTAMDFADGSFDFVVEKGLFDALHAGSGDQVPPAIAEVARVLRPGAIFVSVSFSADRTARLSVGGASGALDCSRTGELTYHRKVNASEAAAEKDKGTAIHVYVCRRKA